MTSQKELKEKYKEYMMDWNDKWCQTYDDLVKYLDTYKTRPYQKANNIDEKQLGSWIVTQKKNYKQKKKKQ
jgi:hypothetical protein